MTNQAPSLDEFLRLNKLSMASFEGKSADEALRMAHLHDKALMHLGGEHCARSLQVRGALLDRLARAKVDNNDSNPPSYDDAGDPDGPSDDDEGDDAPRKKGKKKAKPVKESDPETDDDDGDWPTKKKPVDKENAPPGEKDTSPDKHPPKGARHATDDAVTYAEIRAGMPMTAAQILLMGRVRRGEVASPSLAPRGNDPIARTARDILNAGCRRRGEPERF